MGIEKWSKHCEEENSLWIKCECIVWFKSKVTHHLLLPPTGTNDDIEIILGPRDERTVAQDEGTRLGFVRSSTESEDSRTL